MKGSAFFFTGEVLAVLAGLAIPAWGADGFSKDPQSSCSVFRPNLTEGETVVWKGRCANGYAEGPGIAQWMKGGQITVTFEGNFVAGKLQGKGKMTAGGGDRYEGEYKDGKREGRGVYTMPNGERYEGEYRNNSRHGRGLLLDAAGKRSDVEYRDGQVIAQSSAARSGPTTDPNPRAPASMPGQTAALPQQSALGTAAGPIPAGTQFKVANCIDETRPGQKGSFRQQVAILWASVSREVAVTLERAPDLQTWFPMSRLPESAVAAFAPIIKEAVRFADVRCGVKYPAPAKQLGSALVQVTFFLDPLPAGVPDKTRPTMLHPSSDDQYRMVGAAMTTDGVQFEFINGMSPTSQAAKKASLEAKQRTEARDKGVQEAKARLEDFNKRHRVERYLDANVVQNPVRV